MATDVSTQASGDRPAKRPAGGGGAGRLSSMIVAGGLMAYGLTRPTRLRGLAAAALGGGLFLRGYRGTSRPGLGTVGRRRHPAIGVRAQHGVRVQRSMTINAGRDELYGRWRQIDRLPDFMRHLESVQVIDERHSHWKAIGPFEMKLEWDAEIITDRAGEIIAWRSQPGGDVDTAGSVRFTDAPGGRGTVVTVEIKYDPPGGRPVARLAETFFSGLDQRVQEDLRRFKQLVETGEIPTTKGQPTGERSRIGEALPF